MSPSPLRSSLWIAAVVLPIALGCPAPEEDCRDGRCQTELCPAGWLLQDGACVPAAPDAGVPQLTDPCEPNPCNEPGKASCVPSGAVFLCACDPGYVPDGEACVDPSPAECQDRHPGDMYEPDECAQEANVVPAGGLNEEPHSLGTDAGDRDWYRLEVSAPGIWRVKVTPVEELAFAVDVFAEDATTLVASDRSGIVPVQLGVRATGATTWYVRVAGLTAQTRGAYRISLYEGTPDDYANDGETTKATSMGTTELGQLDYAGDVDALRLQVPARHRVGVSAHWLDDRKTPLELSVSAENDASVSQRFVGTRAEGVLWFRDAKEVLLGIAAPGHARIGEWQLGITDLGPDDHGDTVPDATHLTGSVGATSSAFERDGDVDVFTFEGVPGNVYGFSCAGATPADSCAVRLLDANGNLVDEGTGKVIEVRHEATTTSTHTVEVRSGSGTGAYTWSFLDAGKEDHGDEHFTATAVTLPITLGAKFEHRVDQDVFRFAGAASHIYRATCEAADGACSLKLVDDQGNTLVAAYGTGKQTVTLSVTQPGTYYVHVRSDLSVLHTAYTLTVEDLGLDDHSNDPTGATPITADGLSHPAQFEAPHDRDWFSFQATVGSSWAVTCSGVYGCKVRITDPFGTEVASGTGSAAFASSKDSTYYAEVSNSTASAGQVFPLTYQLQLASAVDDHGDSKATATPIFAPPTATVNGAIALPGDKDVFVITPTFGSTYDLTCQPSGMSSCVIVVHNDVGAQITYDSSSVMAVVRFKASVTANYYVTVSTPATNPAATGTYALVLTEFAKDDHGDTVAHATPIPGIGVTMNGALERTGDLDYFSINLPPGTTHTLTTSGFSLQLMLHEQDYTAIGTFTNTPTFTFTTPASGLVYIRARWGGLGMTTTGTYTLTVQ